MDKNLKGGTHQIVTIPIKLQKQQTPNHIDSIDPIQNFYSNSLHHTLNLQSIPFNPNLFDSDYSPEENQSLIASPKSLPQPNFPIHLHTLELQPSSYSSQLQSNPQFQPQPNQQPQPQPNRRRYSYMPTLTFKAIQKAYRSINFGSFLEYHGDTKLQQETQRLFYLIFEKIIMAATSRKRNKRFLMMVFNDVCEKLNEKIKEQRQVSSQHEQYFKLLNEYGFKVMNYAKMQLREAYAQALSEEYIRNYALEYDFRVDIGVKQRAFYKYLLMIKRQLSLGRISGSVEGDDVEEILEGNIDS